jgi:hypothetical protein
MLRLLSQLRRSELFLSNNGICVHIEQTAQLGGPVLRQLGGGLSSTTTAAGEAARSQLDALHPWVSSSCMSSTYKTAEYVSKYIRPA